VNPQYKIGDRVEFIIHRDEPNIDRACDSASRRAMLEFGVTDDGYFANVQGAERSRNSIRIEFVKYVCTGGMSGWSYVYEFVTWVERSEE
jgi:hypothetical protein